ncbi:hypothetical protein INR49_006186 [Caranx melampygus]|nr:hypothetical protein INR49_006186 [Caranx melampygus]
MAQRERNRLPQSIHTKSHVMRMVHVPHDVGCPQPAAFVIEGLQPGQAEVLSGSYSSQGFSILDSASTWHRRGALHPQTPSDSLCNLETLPPGSLGRSGEAIGGRVHNVVQKAPVCGKPLESAITTPSERILKECHSLYVDNENGLVKIASSLGVRLLPPRKKIIVMIMGNHSAGKSSFINWYVEEHIQTTGVAIETQGFTFITSGRKRESLTTAPLRGMQRYISTRTFDHSSSSKSHKKEGEERGVLSGILFKENGEFSSLCVSSGLEPVDVEVVVQKVRVCLLSEWQHQCGGVRSVCKRARVHWVRTGTLNGMACESHAPSTAVQWSQEELLRNVTAIRDGTAQTPAATAPLRRPEPRNTNDLLLTLQAAFFYFNFIAASGNPLYQAFVYLSQRLWMTHQKSNIYPYVGAAAYHSVGVMDYLSAEISTSKQKKFSLVTFVDTPGLVDGDMIYPFDVNRAITWLALCKRTLNIVEKLSEKCGDKLLFYLSKADEAGKETDRQRVMMQIVQELCRRPGLNKCGFEMPTIYIPNPQKPREKDSDEEGEEDDGECSDYIQDIVKTRRVNCMNGTSSSVQQNMTSDPRVS